MDDFDKARGTIVDLLGQYPGGDKLLKAKQRITVEVVGLAFFDFFHGQIGVAPNIIELHPVLSIKQVE